MPFQLPYRTASIISRQLLLRTRLPHTTLSKFELYSNHVEACPRTVRRITSERSSVSTADVSGLDLDYLRLEQSSSKISKDNASPLYSSLNLRPIFLHSD